MSRVHDGGIMRRLGVALTLLLLAAALNIVTVISPARAAPVPAAPEGPPQGSSPLADFGACLSGMQKGSIILLMDQSGSLSDNDPEQARVQAGQFLVEQLADFAESSGYAIDARVAGFAASYSTPGEWAELTPENVPELNSQVAQVGDDLQTHDTDYWVALESARQDIVDHGSTCSTVFWFSDGEYDIDPRQSSGSLSEFGETKPYAPEISLTDDESAAQAVEIGKQDICRGAGVADQLRTSGITLIGVGLNAGETDFDFFQRVATGGGAAAERNGVEPCGDVETPEGSFYPVADIDSLLMAFDALSNPGDTLRSSTINVCQGRDCAEGEMSIVLDSSLDSVRILATSNVDGLTAYLIPPGSDQPIHFPAGNAGEATENGVAGAWLTPHTVNLEMSAKDVPAWDGTWRVGFFDPDSSSAGEEIQMNVHLSSPLSLVWQNLEETELRQGEIVEGSALALVDRSNGTVLEASELAGSLEAQVTIRDSAGSEHALFSTTDKSDLESLVDIEMPQDISLGAATVTTSLIITTAPPADAGGQGAGTRLDPARSATPTELLPPQDFPVVGTGIDFGVLEEANSADATLDVTGPGCVWLEADSTSIVGIPTDAGAATVAAETEGQDSCLSVGEGESGQLQLTLTTEDHANGAVQGTVTVMIAPEADLGRAQAVEVPFTAELRRPLNVAMVWSAFAIVLLIGIGVPLIGLYVLKWFTARIPKGTLVSGRTRVTIPQPGQGAEISLPRQDLVMTSLPSAQRSISAGGYTFRARSGAAPTTTPWVELDSPLSSISGAVPGARKGVARLPLGVRGNWVAVMDQGSPAAATLIVLLGSEDQAALDSVLADARQRLGERVRGIPKAPGATTAAPAPLGGGPGSAEPTSTGWGGTAGQSAPDSRGWGSPGASGWGSPGGSHSGPLGSSGWNSSGQPGQPGRTSSNADGTGNDRPYGPRPDGGGTSPGWGPADGNSSSGGPSSWGH